MQLRDWATSVGPWFPPGIPGRAHRHHGLPVPAHRVHPRLRPAVRPLARHRDRGRRQHRQRTSRAGAGPRSWMAAQPARCLTRASRSPRREAAPARLAHGHVDAVDPRRAVLGAQLRRGRVLRAGDVLYGGATLAGLLPGTAAVVILGDALTNHINPLLILVSLFTASLGVAGAFLRNPHLPPAPPRRLRRTGRGARDAPLNKCLQ